MALQQHVSILMRAVAAESILPRYRTLAAHEIVEKSPGEIVTSADREAELRLREGLDRLLPGARIIGEEAASEDPALVDQAGEGLVWLIDPLDGTANFAAGCAPFGMMIALVENGIPLESWMLDPLTGRLCHAARGKGATVDGTRVHTRPHAGTPVAALATQFMPPLCRTRLQARAARHFQLEPIPRCAAESYPRLVLGRNQMALFQRILPWDHAPGVLFVEEAGGVATHWNGEAYTVGSGQRGLVVTAHAHVHEAAAIAAEALRLIEPEAIAA